MFPMRSSSEYGEKNGKAGNGFRADSDLAVVPFAASFVRLAVGSIG
jgi:hypothetical protein